MKKLISGIVAVAMALSLAACEKETKVISLSGKTMGTTYHVKYLDEGSMKATSEKTHEEIEAILKRCERENVHLQKRFGIESFQSKYPSEYTD